MDSPPAYVLVENVVGFEGSDTHTVLLELLAQQCYHCQQFMLTPKQFGVPYSRPRYFCLARKAPFATPSKAVLSEDGILACTPQQLLQQHAQAR